MENSPVSWPSSSLRTLLSEAGRTCLVGLCATVLLSACGGGGSDERDADSARDDSSVERDDSSVERDDSSVERHDGSVAPDAQVASDAGTSNPRMDGGSSTLDASTSNPSDGGSTDAPRGMEEPVDGSVLGPPQFTGPPFSPPKPPVQRVAIDPSGLYAVCVVLADHTLECVDSYDMPAQRKSFTQNVPDNRDFVQVVSIAGDGNLFFGLRSDGSVAAFTPRNMGGPWGQAGEKYIGAFGDTSTPCVLRESGEVGCTNGSALPRYPAGPYVQFIGRITDTAGLYTGIRADGVLVTGPTRDGGTLSFRDEIFVGVDMEQAPLFCAIAKSGAIYCGKGVGSFLTLIRQPYSNVRDVSRGQTHVCTALQDGKVMCNDNELGASDSKVPADQRFVDIETAGEERTCGVNESGELWCWGDRSNSLIQVPLPKKAAVQ
jgi:hypothetical protein